MLVNINTTNHSIERVIERYKVSEKEAKMILKLMFNDCDEIKHKGEGRAFKSNKYNMILITDNSKKNLVTVYNPTGKEVFLNFEELLKKEKKFSCVDNLDIKINEFMKELINITIRINEIEISRCEIDKDIKILTNKILEKHNNHEVLIAEYNNKKTQRKKMEEKSKKMNKLRGELIKKSSIEMNFNVQKLTSYDSMINFNIGGIQWLKNIFG